MQGEVGLIELQLVRGRSFANVHHPFIAEIAGDGPSGQDEKKGDMEQQDSPLLPVDQFVFEDVAGDVDGYQPQNDLKPNGVVHQFMCRSCPVVALNKGGPCYGNSENRHEDDGCGHGEKEISCLLHKSGFRGKLIHITTTESVIEMNEYSENSWSYSK